MSRNEQIQNVTNTYNTMCCLLVYEDRVMLNQTIDKLKDEIEKLKL
jgi:hypothetical protein|nr:MAG TPA: envelope glycoprotein [Caudoviricetes sp.]